jgi:hypothetical protein
LQGTLKAKTELAAAVKELSLECRFISIPAPSQHLLRGFLRDVLPYLTGLLVLRTYHNLSTARLIDTALYKEGNGYHMSVPTDLSNLQSLELHATDFVYKYNYILRLPRLRRVCLKDISVLDEKNEDPILPNNWSWTSQSIKELALHLKYGLLDCGYIGLMTNSLQALSRSMPHLESLHIQHHETILSPWTCRALAAIFTPQLAGTLRRLELCDSLPSLFHPKLEYHSDQIDDLSLIDKIQASGLECLLIDWHTLTLKTNESTSVYDRSHAACPLTTLRCLTLRFVEIDTEQLPTWDPGVLEYVQLRFPSLERINLELRLREKADYGVLQKFAKLFDAAGIVFEVQQHNP